ncbi:MAG TPA: permease [Humisphaera sp.]|jgi:hypothetical protein|nr:permease [Humisphaera sp.]
MSDPLDIVLLGTLLRIAQAMIVVAPYFVFGVFAAGLLRALVSRATIRRIAGEDGPPHLLCIFLFVVLLPWASVGTLPVARELERAGLKRWKILLFVLASPLLGALSIAYLLSSETPLYGLATLLACGVVTTIAVLVTARSRRQVAAAADGEPCGSTSGRRLLLAILFACREAAGPALAGLALAMIGVGLLAAFVPDDVLDHGVARPTLAATPLGVAVGLPACLTPVQAVMATGVAYSEGNSYGAALAVLLLGAGVNLATLNWIRRASGPRVLAAWLVATIALLIPLGWAADAVLPHLRTSLDHHHALSQLGLPDALGARAEARAAVGRLIRRDLRDNGSTGLVALSLVVLAGAALRLLDRHDRISARLRSGAPNFPATRVPAFWGRNLSARTMAVCGGVLCAAAATSALYIYYPPPGQILDDMRCAAADARSAQFTGDHAQAIERAQKLVRLSTNLRPSSVLRGKGFGHQQDLAIGELRESAAMFEQSVSRGNGPAISSGAVAVLQNIHKCQTSL